ncbi:MAG: dATP pyrophosphohydrolase [Dongiaceae bacterium]
MPASADIRIVPAQSNPARRDFLRLPLTLYAGATGFAPGLLMERAAAIDARRNPFFDHADAAFWVAYRGDRPVGRISAQVDRLARKRHGADLGHFGYLDAIDDPAVFSALFATAEDWLSAHGTRRVQGPFSLSINEETGLLIDGFDARPMLMMAYHPPFARAHVETSGYAKTKDVIAYDYDVARTLPIESVRLIERAKADLDIRLRPLNMRRYNEDLRIILDIFNDAWADNWGFVPMTEAEVTHTAHEMRQIIVPELVWIAEIDGEPVSMIVCLPNLLEATDDLDGRLLPFGWAKLLWRLKIKGLRTGRVPLFGLRQRYHRSPYGAAVIFMLFDALRQSGVARGISSAELSWILEDNWAIRSIIERIGGRPYKTYRVFEKTLSSPS